MVKLDRLDVRILQMVQDDATTPVAQVAAAVGLSQNACWRRIKRLEADGVIRKRVALLDQDTLGLGVTVFVAIRTSDHSDTWLETFARGVGAIPEVVEFYRMSGDVDYMLKVLVRDIADYDRVYKAIIGVTPLHDVSSSFAMQRIKVTTALPLPG